MIVKDHKLLSQKSEPVVSVEEAIGLVEALEKQLDKTSNGVGLAAIQIGVPKQIGVIKQGDEKVVLINPTVVDFDDEFIFLKEGCLSFPYTFFNTKRYRNFTIDNYVIDGDELRKERQHFYFTDLDEEKHWNTGLITIAVQHEIDHFNGKTIHHHEIKSKPIVSSGKIGRNEPCSCGSGKKYKKCCGKK